MKTSTQHFDTEHSDNRLNVILRGALFRMTETTLILINKLKNLIKGFAQNIHHKPRLKKLAS
jgi:hypothetical protein